MPLDTQQVVNQSKGKKVAVHELNIDCYLWGQFVSNYLAKRTLLSDSLCDLQTTIKWQNQQICDWNTLHKKFHEILVSYPDIWDHMHLLRVSTRFVHALVFPHNLCTNLSDVWTWWKVASVYVSSINSWKSGFPGAQVCLTHVTSWTWKWTVLIYPLCRGGADQCWSRFCTWPCLLPVNLPVFHSLHWYGSNLKWKCLRVNVPAVYASYSNSAQLIHFPGYF